MYFFKNHIFSKTLKNKQKNCTATFFFFTALACTALPNFAFHCSCRGYFCSVKSRQKYSRTLVDPKLQNEITVVPQLGAVARGFHIRNCVLEVGPIDRWDLKTHWFDRGFRLKNVAKSSETRISQMKSCILRIQMGFGTAFSFGAT